MPRENITTRDGRVSIGWTPGQDVQIGIELYPHVEMNSQPVEGVSVTAGGPSAFATVDRTAINRAIRSLRKARDAAYGTDA